MSANFGFQLCRLVPPDRLPDRFLTSGVLKQDDSNLLGNQVVLFYVFEISKPWFPSSRLVPTLTELLTQEHPKLRPGKELDADFEYLLKQANRALNTLSESGETDWIGNFNAILMAISGDELHFSQTGYCPTYILQNNRIRQITDENEHADPHPLKTFANLASGSLQENDYLLLANRELYREVSLDALRRVMKASSPYQAQVNITKELKRNKNAAASAIICKVSTPGDLETAVVEPEEVSLNEAMQSNLKKLARRLAPVFGKVKTASRKAGTASLGVAQKTGTIFKEKVAPKASQILSQGSQSLKGFTGSNKVAVSIEPIGVEEILEESEPVVEVISSRKAREKEKHYQAMAEVAQVESGDIPEETIIPADQFALDSNRPIQKGNQSPTLYTTAIVKLASLTRFIKAKLSWFKTPRRLKVSALVLAILLTSGTIWGTYKKSRVTPKSDAANHNVAILQATTDLKVRLDSAVGLKQNVEASRLISEMDRQLSSIQSPSTTQQAEVKELRDNITTQADVLSQTTRLTQPTFQVLFPEASQAVTTNLPYFYGFNNISSTLLRTGMGDVTQTQATVALTSPNDNIISLSHSTLDGVAAFALTRQNKVYQVVQTSNTTSLKAVSPNSGEFATGDVISTFNGNIYILDGKTGLLWKYGWTGSEYNKGTSVIDINRYDIKKSVSLAIDGAIYILKQDGSLLKFLSGVEQTDFTLKDQPELSKIMVQPVQVITDENMNSIYILDAGVSSADHSTAKVLEFSKSGSFIRQYGFPTDYTNVRDFDINPQEKKLWVVNGSNISEFGI